MKLKKTVEFFDKRCIGLKKEQIEVVLNQLLEENKSAFMYQGMSQTLSILNISPIEYSYLKSGKKQIKIIKIQ